LLDVKNQAAIVGIGAVPFGRRGEFAEQGLVRLAIEAITAACDDAGIRPKDVDGYSSYYSSVEPAELMAAFGAERLRYASQTWGGGGASMCGAFQNAAMAVATDQADFVVVHKVATMEANKRYGQAFGQIGQGIPAVGGPFAFSVPYGLQSPGQMFALAVRRHMHLYGTTRRADGARRDQRARHGAHKSERALPRADHGRRSPGERDDRRSAAPLRFLHGVRLRVRGRDRVGGTGARPAARTRVHRRRIGGRAVPVRQRVDELLQPTRRRLRVERPPRGR